MNVSISAHEEIERTSLSTLQALAPTLMPSLSIEYDRVASLRAHALLDSKPDPYFDDLVGAIAHEFDRPIVKINFIDTDRQWTMSAFGAPAGNSMARSLAFCSHTILDPDGLTLVPDARQDPRFMSNPAVTGRPGIRFYAGAALTDSEGRALGALAVMDTVPGRLNANHAARLRYLAAAASAHLGRYRTRAGAGAHFDHAGAPGSAEFGKLSPTALLESEHRLRFALEVGGLGAWEYDLASGSITASDLCAKAFGLSSGHDLSSYDVVLAATYPDDRNLLESQRRRVLAGDFHVDFEIRSAWPDRSIHWVRITGAASQGLDGHTNKAFGLALDITERKAIAAERECAQQRLIHLAHYDALTGLPNRRLLDETLEAALAQASSDAKAALLCVDLDEFKSINDRLGHDAGDALLRQAANRIAEHLPAGSMLARVGGDEFGVLLAPVLHPAAAEALAHRLLRSLSDPVELDGRPVTLGASIGIAVAGDPSLQPDQLRRNAETALYRAKKSGRNTYRLFHPEMDARLQAREALKAGLQDALAHQQLSLSYQPVIDLATGRAVAFEALMRWKHPERGWISPDEFIPIAEETGWVTRLGRWALRHACTEAASWPEDIRVAVNLSAVQFASGDLVDDVQAALDASGLAADRLELEVTETLLLHDSSVNLATLDGLRRLGARLVMDDFGTGYSSLAYLRKFRFDKIKIDKSLIIGVPDSEGGDTIVEAILGLGRSLGITVTAEGVESAGQLDFLRQNRCAQGQGYLFSPPVPVQDLRTMLQHRWLDPESGPTCQTR